MERNPINEYRARKLGIPSIQYISFSKIKKILECPEYFWAGYGRGIFPEPTQAMLDGKRLDLLFLEFETYKRSVEVSPFKDFFSHEARKWKESMKKLGKLIITEKRAKDDLDLRESVMSHPAVAAIFSDLIWLRHGYAMDEKLGLLYSQPDLRTKSGMLGDVKKVVSVDQAAFNAQQFYNGWYMQLGFYGHVDQLILGTQNRDNKFYVAFEDFFPFRCKVFTLTSDYDAMAEKIWRKGAEKIRGLLDRDPTVQDRKIWFEESHKIEDLRPEYKHVAYHPDFKDLQLGGG